MPATRVDYVNKPYVPERYQDSGYGRTLAQLLLQRGNDQAALHLQRGDAAARAWQGAGNAINNAVAGWQQSSELKAQREIEAAREARSAEAQGLQMEGARMNLAEAKRQQTGAATARAVLPLAQRQDGVYGYDRAVIQREMEAAGHSDMLPEIFKNLDEQEQSHLSVVEAKRDAIAGDAFRVLRGGALDEDTFDSMLDLWEKNDLAPKQDLALMRKAAKAHGVEAALVGAVQSSPKFTQVLQQMQQANKPDLQVVAPGSSVIDKRNPDGGALFTAPAEPKTPTSYEAAILAETDPAKRQALIRENGQRIAAGRAPAAPGPSEPLVSVIGPDGKAVLVPRSEGIGKQPASTREVGRQVTSGDAGDIAEFNTALDDLAVLKSELSGNAATGTAAQIGASLWTPITNLTGWGLDAKQKQAQIDRVKQVIGKALEGGVLRKEDEQKYEKILPTIKDTPELVTSKLNGLVAAVQRRQQRKLDALDSAGYDVSRFGGQGGAADADGWQVVDGIKVRVKP